MVVRHDDIIGIFDIESTSVSKISREYLSEAQKKKRVVDVTGELPKSFIVCRNPNNHHTFTVYTSQISSITLLKRIDFLEDISLPEEKPANR